MNQHTLYSPQDLWFVRGATRTVPHLMRFRTSLARFQLNRDSYRGTPSALPDTPLRVAPNRIVGLSPHLYAIPYEGANRLHVYTPSFTNLEDATRSPSRVDITLQISLGDVEAVAITALDDQLYILAMNGAILLQLNSERGVWQVTRQWTIRGGEIGPSSQIAIFHDVRLRSTLKSRKPTPQRSLRLLLWQRGKGAFSGPLNGDAITLKQESMGLSPDHWREHGVQAISTVRDSAVAFADTSRRIFLSRLAPEVQRCDGLWRISQAKRTQELFPSIDRVGPPAHTVSSALSEVKEHPDKSDLGSSVASLQGPADVSALHIYMAKDVDGLVESLRPHTFVIAADARNPMAYCLTAPAISVTQHQSSRIYPFVGHVPAIEKEGNLVASNLLALESMKISAFLGGSNGSLFMLHDDNMTITALLARSGSSLPESHRKAHSAQESIISKLQELRTT